MPRIKITGVLPKAELGLQADPTTTTTMNPNEISQISFPTPMDSPDELLDLDQEKQDSPVPQKKEWDPLAGESFMKDEEADAYNAMGRKQQRKFDSGLLGKQDTQESMNQYANWYKDKYPISKTLKKIDKLGEGIRIGSVITQSITDRVKQKNWNNWFRESSLPDNMFAAKSASATGNRGDWDINTGIFRPNEIGFKSKGQYTNGLQYPGNTVAYGGTPINENNMQKIRIKITDGSELKRFTKSFMATGGQPMSYTGQMGYGINLGQKRIYTDMPAAKSDEVSNILQPVDRSKANIEAEKGETAWGDLDGDGALEHMTIGGSKHTNGGTPLSVPEGTFIFSDTKDMIIKDEKVLKMFSMGANKKGYTPAEIAKKYEINKYKAIIEDPAADEMRKATAQLMVKSYQKKLAQLALIQEQMKGFPQGIPDVAKKIMPELRDMESSNQQANEQIPQQQDNQQMQVSQEQPQKAQPVGQGMAYGGYFAYGGMPDYAMGGGCLPGELFDEELQMCVKIPRSSENNFQNNNNKYYQQYGNHKPVGLGFNFNNDKKTYNIDVGANSVINNGKVGNIDYNASATFPKLFGNNKGLSVTGKYAGGNLRIGANTKFPLLGGTLGINGRYTQNFNDQNSNSQSMMMSRPNTSQRDLNVGAEWNGKIGKTNVKISGNYGTPANDSYAYGGSSRLGMYDIGGGLDPTTTTTVPPNGIYDQTVSPTQVAKLDDPDYPKLIALLDELATKSGGKYYLSSISAGKQKELSKLITKFGLSHVDEIINGNTVKGYNLSQNSTPGYTWIDPVKKQKVGFFGGMTPEMYEDKVIESIFSSDPNQLAKLTPVQKRRRYFKELGIDDSKFTDAQLADTKKIYTDKKWFREEFYPKFTKTFLSDEYRKQKGDDWQVGLEHYDSYKYKAPITKPPTDKFVCVENSGVKIYDLNNKAHAGLTVYNTQEEAAAVCAQNSSVITNKGKKAPFKYMSPDLATFAAAAAVPPKKYLPWSPQVPFEPGDVVFKDWRAKAAERQSLINKMADQLNTYSPGTSTASNLSFLAGQQAEGLIKDIDDVDSYNVQTANAFGQQEIGRRDKNMAANLGRAEELYRGNVIANQQYDNSKRAYLNNMAKAYGQGWKNRMYLGLLNNVNNKYQVDPNRGYSYWTGSGKGWGDFNNGIGGDASGVYSPKHYHELYQMYKGHGYTDAGADAEARGVINGKKEAISDLNSDRAMLQNYNPNMWGQ